MNKVCIEKKECRYPDKSSLFRPSIKHKENIFEDVFVEQFNEVYELVRNCMIDLGLDADHIGSEQWNPLGEYVKPHDTVLIKPNLVKHINGSNCGEECLYTHPSEKTIMSLA